MKKRKGKSHSALHREPEMQNMSSPINTSLNYHDVVPKSGQFFSRVPKGVFNLILSHTELKEFGRFHQMMQSNNKCNINCERNLR